MNSISLLIPLYTHHFLTHPTHCILNSFLILQVTGLDSGDHEEGEREVRDDHEVPAEECEEVESVEEGEMFCEASNEEVEEGEVLMGEDEEVRKEDNEVESEEKRNEEVRSLKQEMEEVDEDIIPKKNQEYNNEVEGNIEEERVITNDECKTDKDKEEEEESKEEREPEIKIKNDVAQDSIQGEIETPDNNDEKSK